MFGFFDAFGTFGNVSGTSAEMVMRIHQHASTVTGVAVLPRKEKISFSHWTRKHMAAQWYSIAAIARRLPFAADRQGRR